MTCVNKAVYKATANNGKLYVTKRGVWEGTYELPNGKFDRRRFKCMNQKQAIEAYEIWCVEMDENVQRTMRRAVKYKGVSETVITSIQQNTAAGAAKEEENMPAQAGTTRVPRKLYVVQVVGGPAVTYCRTFDKAAQVADALGLAAQASGFEAKYDVMEVKEWAV